VPIVTISRDSFSHGKKIAEKLAHRLGYECIGPEIIQYLSESLDLPARHFEKALRDSPSFVEYMLARKEQSLALFRTAFFEYMCRDNIVYHGLAGHIFLADIPNVLKVRIIADFNDRIREEMRREGLDLEEARKRLIRDDRERDKWTKKMYGIDNHDPNRYDLSLNLHHLSSDAVVATIAGTVQALSPANRGLMIQKLKDTALAARVEARLLEVFPEVEVVARDGEVFVSVKGSIVQEASIRSRAENAAAGIEGVRQLHIGVTPSVFVPF